MAARGAAAGVNTVILSLGCYLLLSAWPCHQKSTMFQGEQLVGRGDGKLLSSENGKFKLQFNYFGKPDFFSKSAYVYLGVWYNNEDTSPVWIANRNAPLQLDSVANLTIDSDGSFKILHTGGEPIIIYENDAATANRSISAALEDSGNLVLYEPDNAGLSREKVLWQSFDYPTDTLLPGMKVGMDHKTGRNWSLASARSTVSAASGSFTFRMSVMELVIWHNGGVIWRSGFLRNGKFSNLGNDSSLNSLYNFSYVSNENQTYFQYSLLDTGTSVFPSLKINTAGFLLGSRATTNKLAVEVGCNWQQGQNQDGCLVRPPLPECRISSGSRPVDFTERLGFIAGGGHFKIDNITLEDCKERCFYECFCFACAPTDQVDGTGCETWISFTATGFRFIGSDYPTARPFYLFPVRDDNRRVSWWLWVTLAVGLAIIIPVLIGFGYLIWIKLKQKGKWNTSDGAADEQQDDDEDELQTFTFEIIAAATNYFSSANKLGEGGFGSVYKGRLANGREIAVKRLSRSSGQGVVEFRNEASLIAKLQHTNLVRLLGLCILRDEKILVYEYMPNKSLDFFLFDDERKRALDWKKRFDIIEGIAQGLLYLHKYSRLRVIHRDLKASNVLLDDDMNPKISDFGMATILGLRESEANTGRIVGTYGYMSPEYAMHGVVSTKIDVFSYGILLLEIVSGRKNNGFYNPHEKPVTLAGYAWQLWKEGEELELLDSTVADSNIQKVLLRCIQIGLLCVQDQATDRPTMSEVVTMLSNETLVLAHPKQPGFFDGKVVEEELAGVGIEGENCSRNGMTISVMEAR